MIWSGWWLSSLSWSKGTRRFSSPSSMSSSRSHFQLTLKLFSSNRSEWGWAGNVSNGYSMESQYVCRPGDVAMHTDTERESQRYRICTWYLGILPCVETTTAPNTRNMGSLCTPLSHYYLFSWQVHTSGMTCHSYLHYLKPKKRASAALDVEGGWLVR